MALIAIANALAYENRVDIDKGERDNVYTSINFPASTTKYVDEADINPYLGDSVFAKSLPNMLAAGTLTVTESHIDNITDLSKKNFIAGGLGIKYYYAGGTFATKDIVMLDGDNGKLSYPTALGAGSAQETLVGVVRQDGTSDQYIRVKTSGTATVVAGEALVVGDKVAGNTNGTAGKVTDTGKYHVGVVTVGGASGADITITVSAGVL